MEDPGAEGAAVTREATFLPSLIALFRRDADPQTRRAVLRGLAAVRGASAGSELVAQVLDNVVRPVLIKRGADLSLLLILPGVIGGLLWLGIIGLFVGPVILAVTSALLESWISSALAEPELDRTLPPIAAATHEEPGPVLHG